MSSRLFLAVPTSVQPRGFTGQRSRGRRANPLGFTVRSAFLSVLLATSAWADGELTAPPVQPLQKSAWAVSAVGVSLASCAASVGAAALIQNAYFQAAGHPDPVVYAVSLAVGMGVNMVATSFLFPELARFANSDAWAGDVAVSRQTAWGLARWAALGAGAGALTFGIGGLLDRGNYGSGQGLIIAGALAFLISAVVWDVLDAVGAWSGMVGSRAPR